jgi:chromosome segregation ATPase
MSTIDIQLRRIKNETLNDIQLLERNIQRCQENISRLKSNKQQFNPDVLLKRNQADIDRMRSELQQAQLKVEQIENGVYEDQLKKEMEETRKMIEQKSKVTQKRRSEASTLMSKNNPQPKPTNAQRTNNTPRQRSSWMSPDSYHYAREFDYAERQYFRDCSTLPDYLREKLKNMPNNLGYVWKNIWFFGEKPASHQHEYILYEKQHHQFLMHVYNLHNRTYTLYDKDNTGKKKCLDKRPF